VNSERPIPKGRTPILLLLAIAKGAMADPRYRHRRFQKHREAWVLGHFSELYNVFPGRVSLFSSAELGDSEAIPADFAIFSADGAWVCDIEVTELTDVWDWWREAEGWSEIPEVENPWARLPRLLQQKYAKAARYRDPTWLVVYDNECSDLYKMLEGVNFGAAEFGHSVIRRMGFGVSSIGNVWILSSDGRAAARIFPDTQLLGQCPGAIDEVTADELPRDVRRLLGME